MATACSTRCLGDQPYDADKHRRCYSEHYYLDIAYGLPGLVGLSAAGYDLQTQPWSTIGIAMAASYFVIQHVLLKNASPLTQTYLQPYPLMGLTAGYFAGMSRQAGVASSLALGASATALFVGVQYQPTERLFAMRLWSGERDMHTAGFDGTVDLSRNPISLEQDP